MSKENLKSNYQTPSSVARKTNVICTQKMVDGKSKVTLQYA